MNSVPRQLQLHLQRGAVLSIAWSMRAVWIAGLALFGGVAVSHAATHGLLRATVIDAQTGELTPCTVELIDSSGAIVRESEAFRNGFRSSGRFEKSLPAGPAQVRITRGFETRRVERTVVVPADGSIELTVSLERVVNLRQRGWYAGDSHAHMIHGERTLPVTFDEVARAARAEDLQYLSLAQAWILKEPTSHALATELEQRSTPDCVLTWNLEAPKNYYRGDAGHCLGHCWTLGMRGRTDTGAEALKILLDASAHDYESDKPTFANFESHRFIRSLGGAVFYTHPARWWTGPWGGRGGYPERLQMRISNMAVELPLDTLAGPTYDGIDLMTTGGELEANAKAFELWCLLLNHGYRLAGTASSDACFDRVNGAVPGVVRTYTHLDSAFSIPAVTRAMTAGRNFVTSGPLLLVSLEGQPPGSAYPADGRVRSLRIEAWASGADPTGLTRLEILRNGKVIETNLYDPPVESLTKSVAIEESGNAWYCARLWGGDPRRQRAISGAFFFETADAVAPVPVPMRVQFEVRDAQTGEALSGSLVEVAQPSDMEQPTGRHPFTAGAGECRIPATSRLRAEVPGYRAMTQSPFLEDASLVTFITGLNAEDLLEWQTFEETRRRMNEVRLRFDLEKVEEK